VVTIDLVVQSAEEACQVVEVNLDPGHMIVAEVTAGTVEVDVGGQGARDGEMVLVREPEDLERQFKVAA
jgi:hypothetical protein